jgi:hypothetical protein
VSKRTKVLLVLVQSAILAVIALGASAVTLLVKGFGMAGVEPLMPWFLLALVAMLVLRFAFFRSLHRDQDALHRDDSRTE